MSEQPLPEAFQDLAFWTTHWCKPSEAERNLARVTSTMEEIQAFYDAVFPRMAAIYEFLTGYTEENAPQEVLNLMYLAKSLNEAALCVELFKQPTVPDGFDWRRFEIVSPN